MRVLWLPSGGLDTRLLVSGGREARVSDDSPHGGSCTPRARAALWAVLPYLPTYLPTYLPGYLPTYYLLTYYLHTYPPTYLPTHRVPTYLHTYLPVLRSGGYRRVGLTDRLID